MSEKKVELRDGPPWGFRLSGGIETSLPIRITRVSFFILFPRHRILRPRWSNLSRVRPLHLRLYWKNTSY